MIVPFIRQKLREMNDTFKAMKILIKSLKPFLNIIFLDYQNSNYFNEISIKFPENKDFEGFKFEINKNIIQIPILPLLFKNKRILTAEISLINTDTKTSRVFRISLYKDFLNNINLYLNNKSKKFYCSEIIFYGEINKVQLKGFSFNTFDLQKRMRCILLNIEQNELFEIIKNNNNYNRELNTKICQALSNNFNKNLLINIFMGTNQSNVLLFTEEEKKLIIATEEEKNKFSKFYNNIMNSINDEEKINEIYKSFENKLISKQRLFGTNIATIREKAINKIILSFLGQGINCLLDNNIINENDKYFIFGCLLLLLYFRENESHIKISDIIIFNIIIDQMKKNKFDSLEQIKAATSYITFFIVNPVLFTLEITKKLKDDNPFKKGFNFYKSIIEDLTEDSELMFIFLQLNSGSGKEIINDKNCYKISMISISEIKEHLINNIPKFFFYYHDKNVNNIAISDSITQILAFNKEKIFSHQNNNNSNAMNVSIGMFHEGGHQKYRMDILVGSDIEPILFMDKTYKLLSQEILDLFKGNKGYLRGESGMCVDYYLYNFPLNPAQIIISSFQSYKLMDKSLYIGKLDNLNKIATEIINEYLNNNKAYPNYSSFEDDIEALNDIDKKIQKDDKEDLHDNYIIIEGQKHYCGFGVNYL